MWDGRELSLEQQAIDATLGHGQTALAPTADQVAAIVAFETDVFSAQLVDAQAGRLDALGGRGGPRRLSKALPFVADSLTFNEYNRWRNLGGRQGSIARGQVIFNTRTFTVSNVDGFNDRFDVGNLALRTTCSACHNVANSGADFQSNPQRNIGVGGTAVGFGGPAAASDLPRFTLTCHADAVPGFAGHGPIVTNDPGRALITGRCADIGKFTIPQLRALAAREPYFHDGSAKTLGAVVDFYNTRFNIGFSAQEKLDLVNFLAAL
jgi:cytochrome c peroxidase